MSATFHSPGFATNKIAEAVRRILSGTPLCSMAPLGAGDHLHINTAFFAWNEAVELFFLSAPDSVHSRNLERVPTMAVAVFDSHQPWGALHRGLQLFGTAGRVDAARVGEVESLYARRFERYGEFKAAGRGAFTELRFYAFQAAALKLLDEEEFGEATLVSAEIVRSS
jgi:uncharacterized protein YhbP (UPF0306 family)